MRTALWMSASLLLVACSTENGLVGAGNDAEPTLTLDDPAAAEFLRDGATNVTGTATALRGVQVNGLDAEISNDQYATQIDLARGVNIVEARGTDDLGNAMYKRHGVLAGEYADPDQDVRDAMGVRVNQDGLDKLLGFASDQINPQALAPTVEAANPVYTYDVQVEGIGLGTLNVDIASLQFDDLSLFADPKPDNLFVDVHVPNLDVTIDVWGNAIGWDFSTAAWLWADRIEVRGNVQLDVVNGKLKADFADPDLELVGLGVDLELIPGDYEQYIFIDFVVDRIEDLVVEQIEEAVPGLLEERLGELELAYETELMGEQLSVAAEFDRALVDDDGVELGFDLGIDMNAYGSVAPGYLVAPQSTATLDHDSDVAVALADDLFNRVLFEAWDTNLLFMEMSTDDGSLDPAMLESLKADQGSITVDAKLPPVIVEKADGLQAQIGELDIIIETPGGEMGDYLRVAAAVFIDVEMRVTNGVVHLSLGTPELVLQVRDTDWGATNEATTALLEEMLPIDSLIGLLGDIEFELPTFEGMGVQTAYVERDVSGYHTGVDITLY